MKNLKKEILYICIISIFLFLLLDLKFWPAYNNSSIKQEQTELSFSNLKEITWDIYLWPDKNLYKRLNNFFNTTNQYLNIQTYDFTNKNIKNSLKELDKQWVDINIILENDKYQQYQNTFKDIQEYFLNNKNIKIKSDEEMWTTYVHSKIMLNEKSFRIQTANLTKSSFESNREHFFFSSDKWFHDSLKEVFDADWKWQDLSNLKLHPNLVICPINCRNVISKLLNEAKSSIIIQTQYITDPEILKILQKKSSEINLAIIVADTNENHKFVSYFGPWIARTLTSNYNHTKMILIDEKYLLLWSMNLSENSLDNNREFGIILLNKDNIKTFLKWFKEDRLNNTI